MLIVVPVAPNIMAVLVFERPPDEPAFTAANRKTGDAVAQVLNAECQRWIRILGLTDGCLLTQREQDVQRCLIAGLSEDEGAAQLGIRSGSFHQVVVGLYKKRGVKSRGQLLSRFLLPADATTLNHLKVVNIGEY